MNPFRPCSPKTYLCSVNNMPIITECRPRTVRRTAASAVREPKIARTCVFSVEYTITFFVLKMKSRRRFWAVTGPCCMATAIAEPRTRFKPGRSYSDRIEWIRVEMRLHTKTHRQSLVLIARRKKNKLRYICLVVCYDNM